MYMKEGTMKKLLALLLLVLPVFLFAQQKTLIRNVEVLDGIHKKTVKGDVLVEGNKISKIFQKPIVAGQDVKVMDGQGKFLMPGLIDAHYHGMMDQAAFSKMPNVDMPYLTLYAAKSSEELLMRGLRPFAMSAATACL